MVRFYFQGYALSWFLHIDKVLGFGFDQLLPDKIVG